MINRMSITFAIATSVIVILLPSPSESLDGKGNAIYTRMEIIDIVDGWCAGKPWTVSMMKRFIDCRQSSTSDELMKKGEECAASFLKDMDFSKIKGESSERSWVCSHKDKGEVLDLHEKIWNCAKFSPEQILDLNTKIKTCMEKKAREEEDEFLKKKAEG